MKIKVALALLGSCGIGVGCAAPVEAEVLPIRFHIQEDPQVGPPVPEEAPDTVPGWFYADENIRGGTACSSGRMLRGIVALKFESGATRAERHRAVGAVDGVVVGGVSSGVGEGYYYVQVEDDPEGRILCDAIDALNALPYVAIAHASHQVSLLTPG